MLPGTHRSLPVLAFWLVGGLPLVWAGTAGAAETPASLTNLVLWDKSLDVRAGVGYKDNVLYSPGNREGSAFATAGLDLILLRLSSSGSLLSLFASGDETRYFHAPGADQEQSLITEAKLTQDFGRKWKGSFAVQYFYQNQVLDASLTDTNLSTVKAQGHNFRASPSVDRVLGQHYWAGLELGAERQLFSTPLQSYWQGGPKLILGRKWARRASLALSYSLQRRGYDHFEQIALDETPIPGTTVAFWIHRIELVWQREWDRARHWRSTTRLSYGLNRDNGPGFFDYEEYRLVEQLRYHAAPWQFEGRVGVSHYDFDRQTVGLANLSRRQRTGLTLDLRGERKLVKSLKAFVDYQYERSWSNLSFDQYQVNAVTTGVDWEF
jgi:hypothetical protein